MTQSKYTPAPWSTLHRKREPNDYISGADTYHAVCEGKKLTTIGEEGKANARLIAAAPELLEALEGAVPSIEYELRSLKCEFSTYPNGDIQQGDIDECKDRLDAANATIAKARGES